FSAYTKRLNVTLSGTGTAQGFNGAVGTGFFGSGLANVLQTFLNIGTLKGPVDKVAAALSSLTGLTSAKATWSLPDTTTGLDSYSISSIKNTISFTDFTQLVGGESQDVFRINRPNEPVNLKGGGGVTAFVFADKASVTGSINGGGGFSGLYWNDYSTA